jgi:hypothetical protein
LGAGLAKGAFFFDWTCTCRGFAGALTGAAFAYAMFDGVLAAGAAGFTGLGWGFAAGRGFAVAGRGFARTCVIGACLGATGEGLFTCAFSGTCGLTCGFGFICGRACGFAWVCCLSCGLISRCGFPFAA